MFENTQGSIRNWTKKNQTKITLTVVGISTIAAVYYKGKSKGRLDFQFIFQDAAEEIFDTKTSTHKR